MAQCLRLYTTHEEPLSLVSSIYNQSSRFLHQEYPIALGFSETSLMGLYPIHTNI